MRRASVHTFEKREGERARKRTGERRKTLKITEKTTEFMIYHRWIAFGLAFSWRFIHYTFFVNGVCVACGWGLCTQSIRDPSEDGMRRNMKNVRAGHRNIQYSQCSMLVPAHNTFHYYINRAFVSAFCARSCDRGVPYANSFQSSNVHHFCLFPHFSLLSFYSSSLFACERDISFRLTHVRKSNICDVSWTHYTVQRTLYTHRTMFSTGTSLRFSSLAKFMKRSPSSSPPPPMPPPPQLQINSQFRFRSFFIFIF